MFLRKFSFAWKGQEGVRTTFPIFSVNYFVLFLIFGSGSERHSVVSDSLRSHGLSMGFSRPEYWSGKPFPSPGDLPNPGIEPRSPALQADSLPTEPQLWLHWVFIALDVLSLIAVSEDYLDEVCRLLIEMASLFRGTDPRHVSSVVVAHGLGCPMASGISRDQGSNCTGRRILIQCTTREVLASFVFKVALKCILLAPRSNQLS